MTKLPQNIKKASPVRSIPESPYYYNDEVIRWQQSLSDSQLRALASDYLMGRLSPDTIDAYEEYQRRFADQPEEAPKGVRRSKRARANRSSKSSRYK